MYVNSLEKRLLSPQEDQHEGKGRGTTFEVRGPWLKSQLSHSLCNPETPCHVHSFIQICLFIQQTFIKHLLCARQCAYTSLWHKSLKDPWSRSPWGRDRNTISLMGPSFSGTASDVRCRGTRGEGRRQKGIGRW